MLPSIRTVIADDEPLARRRIRDLLVADPEIEIVAECEDGARTAECVRTQRPALLFLDIKMPELDAFDVLETFDEECAPVVVFVTAFDEFALRAFEVHAFDYLLKPFDRDRFRTTLDRAKRQVRSADVATVALQLQKLLADMRPPVAAPEQLPIRSDGKVRFVPTGEIDWIEADDDVVHIHVGRDVLTCRDTLSHLEARLPASRFVRVHRSAIINLARVREVQPWFSGDYVIIMADGARVTTGRTYRSRVRQILS
jgi:two-component system LytT family response regulator